MCRETCACETKQKWNAWKPNVRLFLCGCGVTAGKRAMWSVPSRSLSSNHIGHRRNAQAPGQETKRLKITECQLADDWGLWMGGRRDSRTVEIILSPWQATKEQRQRRRRRRRGGGDLYLSVLVEAGGQKQSWTFFFFFLFSQNCTTESGRSDVMHPEVHWLF